METCKILNINIYNTSLKELLKKIKKGGFVVTPNLDHMVKLQKDVDFFVAYSNADYVICDSKILQWTSWFLGNKIQEKISGSDFFPQFYDYYKHDKSIRIFLLGGSKGIADLARQNINHKVGREIVVGSDSPSFNFASNERESQKIVKLINESKATVLAVGVGAPKQEKWINKYRNELKNIKIFLAIGATIDFEARRLKRAPKWMSDRGLEWLYRLLCDPKRLWKRYLVESLPFFWLILQQKFNFYQYKEPIWLILQKADLLSQEQVDCILSLQSKNSQLCCSEIVVQNGWLKAETVKFFAREFNQLATQPKRKTIEQLCRAASLLNEQQIAEILKDQESTNFKFEEIAVNKNWLTPKTIEFLLNYCIPRSS